MLKFRRHLKQFMFFLTFTSVKIIPLKIKSMLRGNCKYSMFAKVQSKLTELLTRCNQDTARPHLLPTLFFNLKFTS